MIDKLTKRQEEQIPKFIQKIIAIASQKNDRKKATKAVQELYANAKFDKPIVIFGKTPFQTAIMVSMCKILFKEEIIKVSSQLRSQLHSQLSSQIDSQLDSQLYSQLDSQLSSQLYSQLSSQLYSQLDSQLSSQLYSQLDSQLSSQLYSQLSSQLRSQLYSQLDSQLSSQLYSQLYSQLSKINNDWWSISWWLVWAGWYSYAKYIGVKFDNNVYKIFMDFVTNVSFIIPYKGIAFVSEKPKEIHFDNQLLHNEKGPAVTYGEEDSNTYSLKGVKFEKEWWDKIVNDRMTPDEIFAIDNVEHRRIAFDYMDKSKMLTLKDYKVLDEQIDEQGNPMKILSFTVQKMKEPLKFYQCVCPTTKKMYHLGTDANTCAGAKAKLWGFSKDEIKFVAEY